MGRAISITMDSVDIKKYNFENLQGSNFYQRLEVNAIIDILPGILREIDLENVEVYF